MFNVIARIVLFSTFLGHHSMARATEEWLLVLGERHKDPFWGIVRLDNKTIERDFRGEIGGTTRFGFLKLILPEMMHGIRLTVSETALGGLNKRQKPLEDTDRRRSAWEWLNYFLKSLDHSPQGILYTLQLSVDVTGDIPTGTTRKLFQPKSCQLVAADNKRHLALVNLTNTLTENLRTKYGASARNGERLGEAVSQAIKPENLSEIWREILSQVFDGGWIQVRSDLKRGLIWFEIRDGSGEAFDAALNSIAK